MITFQVFVELLPVDAEAAADIGYRLRFIAFNPKVFGEDLARCLVHVPEFRSTEIGSAGKPLINRLIVPPAKSAAKASVVACLPLAIFFKF